MVLPGAKVTVKVSPYYLNAKVNRLTQQSIG